MATVKTSRKVTLGCPQCGRLNRVDLSRIRDRPRCGRCSAPIAVDTPVQVTEQTLDRLVRDAEVPVLVDFYADWCGPCKMMGPILDSLARERAGGLVVAKLDTDRNAAASHRFSVRGIPTLILFRNGREIAREVGAVSRPRLEALVDSAPGADSR